MKVDILLSIYNGEDYIEQLIESLQKQTYTNWQLLVRDDGSTDQTLAKLEKSMQKLENKLILIENNKQNLGPKGSFEKLVEFSSSDYIMYCDQDDYWLPEKIELSMQKILALENENPYKAVLVFTDLAIVDQNLQKVHSSFWSFSKISPDNALNTYRLLINNPAPGCTLLFNSKVKKLILPFSSEAIMHDWWTTLRVSESGVVAYINKPTILYRQHGANSVGAEQIDRCYIKNRIAGFKTTYQRNLQTYRVMKDLEGQYSILKLAYYKLIISLARTI